MNCDGIDPGWLWLIGGVVLLIAEVIAPGFFLIFVGAAALATGLFTLLFGLGTAPQLALFALYALLAVMIGRRFYANRHSLSADPLLNDPARRLVGKVVTVVAAVDDHSGRVRVGDSEWSARGGPAAVGERVRITGVDGNCLKVEAGAPPSARVNRSAFLARIPDFPPRDDRRARRISCPAPIRQSNAGLGGTAPPMLRPAHYWTSSPKISFVFIRKARRPWHRHRRARRAPLAA